jgi:plasmid stabilization system protein ParE
MPIDLLKQQFEHSAQWRREKAEQYPRHARRNLEAAKRLDRLAETCKDVTPQTREAYERLCSDEHNNFQASEAEQQMIGSISIDYNNAEEFIQALVGLFPDEEGQS